jgi:hypothetical protein
MVRINLLHVAAKFWRSDMKKILSAANNQDHNGVDDEHARGLAQILKAIGDANELVPQQKDRVV